MKELTKEMQKYATDMGNDGETSSTIEVNLTNVLDSKWGRLEELAQETGKAPGDIRDGIVKKVMENR